MSISTKLILRYNKILTNDEHPIMLRITINRQSQFVTTKKSSSVENWDEKAQSVRKSHPDHRTINPLLKSINSKIDLILLNAGEEQEIVSFDDVKNVVLRMTVTDRDIKSQNLLEYFDTVINRLKEQDRLGYAETFDSTKKCLKRFTGNRDYPFLNIQLSFLNKFEGDLLKRNCAATTRSVYFRTFRTLWKMAIKDKVCPEKHYPFKDFSFAKYNNPRTKKRAITKPQIDLIADIKIGADQDTLINSRNYFLFSFYCRGLNFTDLAELKWGNICEGELSYTRAKTGEDFRFKLHDQALRIIEHYKNLDGSSDAGYIFPILYKRHDTPKAIRFRKQKILKRVNRDIKELAKSVGIERTVTTYVARHSYASILRSNGVSKEIIGQTMGHDSLKTTDIYLDDIGDPVLDALINAAL
ncbi:Site-specific recombinase XerD [Mucilaginibacter pineti]|uniref:Site-specific recombinase XerD n=1 Tax=Mucilaginibacter pineti TaxID=1391627 RepID=A0A1G7CQ02_9SPHI|nr:site-specific integrase [Mucilaginibacter pineti]SDE41422.1 Site-specific recombinase XerD [Mucilaginibacter pineti]